MVSNTTEQALEAAIEKHLTGSSLEERKAGDSEERSGERPFSYRSTELFIKPAMLEMLKQVMAL